MKKMLCMMVVVLLCIGLFGCANASVTDTYSDGNVDNASKTVDHKEQAKQKLKEAYELYGCNQKQFTYAKNMVYAELTSDGTSLTVDTKPENSYMDYSNKIFTYIEQINQHLSLPSSVTAKMERTRALDGMISETYGNYVITWTYHPDNGLEVIYEVR